MILSPVATDLWIPGIPLLEKVARSVIVYLFLVVVLRLAGKRTLGQVTSFDLVVLLLLSNTVQNAIIGNDNSLSGGLVGAVVIIALNYAIVRILYNHKRVERAVEGGTDILMHHGKFVDAHMRRELITHARARRPRRDARASRSCRTSASRDSRSAARSRSSSRAPPSRSATSPTWSSGSTGSRRRAQRLTRGPQRRLPGCDARRCRRTNLALCSEEYL